MRQPLFALGAVAALAGPAVAQPACSGQWGVVRTSTVKPGQMALFKKAVADQHAWYRSHGITDNSQKIGMVVAADGSFSQAEAVTLHMNAPTSQPAHDAGWDAFIKEFRDSSDMVSEKRVCLVDPG